MKRTEVCEVHGSPSRAANRTLLLMVLAACSLIVWHVWVYGPSVRTARPETLQRPFPLLLGIEAWDLLFTRSGILAELWDVFPYFMAGVLIAGYLRTYKIAVKLRSALKRYGFSSIFLASLVGIITPLCACGTITTAMGLLFAGLPLAPVMALLVTSPLMSPSTYLLTLNDLGPEWTAIRTISAFSMGMFAGIVTHVLRNRGFQTKELFIDGAVPRGDLHDEDYPDARLRCNCRETFGNRIAARTGNMFVVFLAKSSEMLWTVGKYVLVGVAIGTIVERYLPYEWIYRLFGRQDPLSIVWITLGSIPLFLHQISASSIVYHIKSSLQGTLDGGAALAFMIGGPVTAVPTMVLFWTIFKKKVFILYLSVCVVGTILISYAFQFFVFVPHVDAGNPLLKDVRSLSGGTASVISKKSRNVRIVMDPGGNGLIATYVNDLEGHGGIVFDGGGDRFLNASADRCDNRTYIGNVADWLEQNSSSMTKGKILIYDASPAAGTLNHAMGAETAALLKQKGFTVRNTDRLETPVVTGGLLEDSGQLWIFFNGGGPGTIFSDAELEVISRFIASGKGMVIAAGNKLDAAAASAANRLASRYGVVFTGSVQNNDELSVSTASYFFTRASGLVGKILKFTHKT